MGEPDRAIPVAILAVSAARRVPLQMRKHCSTVWAQCLCELLLDLDLDDDSRDYIERVAWGAVGDVPDIVYEPNRLPASKAAGFAYWGLRHGSLLGDVFEHSIMQSVKYAVQAGVPKDKLTALIALHLA